MYGNLALKANKLPRPAPTKTPPGPYVCAAGGPAPALFFPFSDGYFYFCS